MFVLIMLFFFPSFFFSKVTKIEFQKVHKARFEFSFFNHSSNYSIKRYERHH